MRSEVKTHENWMECENVFYETMARARISNNVQFMAMTLILCQLLFILAFNCSHYFVVRWDGQDIYRRRIACLGACVFLGSLSRHMESHYGHINTSLRAPLFAAYFSFFHRRAIELDWSTRRKVTAQQCVIHRQINCHSSQWQRVLQSWNDDAMHDACRSRISFSTKVKWKW